MPSAPALVPLTEPVGVRFGRGGSGRGGHAARLLLLYTGGTIGMVEGDSGALQPLDLRTLAARLPSLDDVELELTVLAYEDPIDSADAGPDDWATMASVVADHHDEQDGFVILHGTDTMAFSASALSFLLVGLAKPVVLTGAQLPVTKVRSDGRENLVTALAVAAATDGDGRAVVPEVGVYFDNVLLRGNRSRKTHASRFHAFESPNLPPLATAGIIIDYSRHLIRPPAPAGTPVLAASPAEPMVAGLRLFPGITPAAVARVLEQPGLRGVVLETFGAGNAPTAPWFLEALREATDRGVVVVNVTQCGGGGVDMGRYETSEHLGAAGVVGGADMTVEAAVTKLMVLLGRHGLEEVRRLVPVDLAGELTSTG